MAVNETIKSGFYRVWNELEGMWNRYSFKGLAKDTVFDDGNDAETKHGAINGITSSFASTATDIAASASTVYELNKNLSEFQTSFQDGCSTIAAAITDMGVATADNASPEEMAANIKAIETKTGNIAGVGAFFEYSGTEGKTWSGATGIVYWSGRTLYVNTAGTYSVNNATAKTYAKGAAVYSYSIPSWGNTTGGTVTVKYA